jgi:hypothetical protein
MQLVMRLQPFIGRLNAATCGVLVRLVKGMTDSAAVGLLTAEQKAKPTKRKKSVSDDENLPSLNVLTQTVQTFCRRFQHDSQFAINVNNCFSNSGWSDLQKIYRFLKT